MGWGEHFPGGACPQTNYQLECIRKEVQLGEKEERLRMDKEQLRIEKMQLRKKEVQLGEEEERLRKEDQLTTMMLPPSSNFHEAAVKTLVGEIVLTRYNNTCLAENTLEKERDELKIQVAQLNDRCRHLTEEKNQWRRRAQALKRGEEVWSPDD